METSAYLTVMGGPAILVSHVPRGWASKFIAVGEGRHLPNRPSPPK